MRISSSAFAMLTVTVILSLAPPAQAAEKTEPERFRGEVYVRRGDDPLRAEVYVPPGKGPFPGVLVVHGGAWRTGNRFQMSGVCRTLVQAGYCSVTIDYRLAPKHVFPAQIEDCKEALRWMRRSADRFRIDPKRFAGYGYSAGGHLVALLGTTDPSHGLEGPGGKGNVPSTRLQAVVAGGAPCDFSPLPADNRHLAYWLGGTRSEKPDMYRLASPANFVSRDDPPMFFFHGQRDRLVPPSSPVKMVAKLKASNIRAEHYVVSDGGHVATFLDKKAVGKAVGFLDSVLKKK